MESIVLGYEKSFCFRSVERLHKTNVKKKIHTFYFLTLRFINETHIKSYIKSMKANSTKQIHVKIHTLLNIIKSVCSIESTKDSFTTVTTCI